MTVLLRKLFWFVMFLAATFGFYVFFEHGTENYPANATQEFEQLKAKVVEIQAGKKPESPVKEYQ